MANLLAITSWVGLDGTTLPAATAVIINVKDIISVQTRATAFNTTGVTNVTYPIPKNNDRTQVTFIVTETAAAIVTASNANAVAT